MENAVFTRTDSDYQGGRIDLFIRILSILGRRR
jgi:hypothetical protein